MAKALVFKNSIAEKSDVVEVTAQVQPCGALGIYILGDIVIELDPRSGTVTVFPDDIAAYLGLDTVKVVEA